MATSKMMTIIRSVTSADVFNDAKADGRRSIKICANDSVVSAVETALVNAGCDVERKKYDISYSTRHKVIHRLWVDDNNSVGVGMTPDELAAAKLARDADKVKRAEVKKADAARKAHDVLRNQIGYIADRISAFDYDIKSLRKSHKELYNDMHKDFTKMIKALNVAAKEME